MTDPYGLPESVRGDLSDDWFALTGRLVIVTALVELKIFNLCAAVTGDDAKALGVKTLSDVLKRCRVGLRSVNSKDRRVIEDWLIEANVVRTYRHDIVHSHWPEETFGWRPPMSSKEDPRVGDDGLIVVRTNLEELRYMVSRASQVVERGNEMAARSQAQWSD